MKPDLELRDYRRALTHSGDVSVGAFARRRRRTRILIATGGAALLLLAGVLYSFLRPPARTIPATFEVHVLCAAAECGHVAQLRVPVGRQFPIACPACGQHAARPLWRCHECSHEFLPRDESAPACPRCRSTKVGSAAASP